MTEKPIWTQETTLHYSLRSGARRIDLRYEPAGFQSGWAVYVGSNLVERCAEFMQARGVALEAAQTA